MAVRRKVRKLHEFFEEEAMRTSRPRKAMGLVQALEEFTRAHKQRVEQALAQRTLERLREVKEDVERRRAARRPSARRPSARRPSARRPSAHARPRAQAKAETKDDAAVGEDAEGEKADGDAAMGNGLSPAVSLSCLSDDSGDIWCPPLGASLESAVLPGNFRPLEDLSRDDLARIYSKESYMERRRLFKEACRKRFGRHVWTWEHLTGFEPRSLSDTCSVPPVDAHERQRLNRRQVSPSKMQGLIRQVHRDLEDEEKELELKFLELEMKMNPHVAEEGLYDYHPEVLAELHDALSATQRVPRMNVRRRWKRVWNPVPKATLMRAKQRETNAASSSDESASETEHKRLKDLLLYDAKNKCFLPPQAMLRRAKVHERLAEDRRLMEELEIERKASTKYRVSPVRCRKTVGMAAASNLKSRKIRSGGGDATIKKTTKKSGVKNNIDRSSKKTGADFKSDDEEIPCRNLDRGDALSEVDEPESERCSSVENEDNTNVFVGICSVNIPPDRESDFHDESTENRTPFGSPEREPAEVYRRASPISDRVRPPSKNGSTKTHTPSCSSPERDPSQLIPITSPTSDSDRPSTRMIRSPQTRNLSSPSAKRDPQDGFGISSCSDLSRLSPKLIGSTRVSSSSSERDTSEMSQIAHPTFDSGCAPSRMIQSTETLISSSPSAERDLSKVLRIMSPSFDRIRSPSAIIEWTRTPTPSSSSIRNDGAEVIPTASVTSGSVPYASDSSKSRNPSPVEEELVQFLRNLSPTCDSVLPTSKGIESHTDTRTTPSSLDEKESSEIMPITSPTSGSVYPLSRRNYSSTEASKSRLSVQEITGAHRITFPTTGLPEN